MIRKGIRFRESRTLVTFIPTDDQLDQLRAEKLVPPGKIHPGYVFAAKIVPQNAKTLPKNALETRRKWNEGGAPVMVTPIQITGWSRTNMFYANLHGKPRTIWVEDGRVYIG